MNKPLFTNLTPVNKQIEMAQYIINEHTEYKGKVIEVRHGGYDFTKLLIAVIIFEEGTAVDEMVFIKGSLAEDLLKIE